MLPRWLVHLAWRYAKSRHSNGFITFISLSSVIGIGLGVAVLIVLLSVMNGFERALTDKLLALVPHGELIAIEGSLPATMAEKQHYAAYPGIKAVAPVFHFTVLLEKGSRLKTVLVRAVSPQREKQVSIVHQLVRQGRWQDLAMNNGLVLGDSLARQLGVRPGDKLTLLLVPPAAGSQRGLPLPSRHVMTLVATVAMGGQLDSSLAYVSLDTARQWLHLDGDRIGGVRFAFDNVFAAPALMREIGFAQPLPLYIHSWDRQQGHLYRDIQLVRQIMWLVLILVIAVACFNIVSTLMMAVKEKQDDIAILMTQGMQRHQVVWLFVLQGMIYAFAGLVFGVVSGVALAVNLPRLTTALENWLGRPLLSEQIYFVSQIPAELHWQDVVLVAVVTALMAMLAAFVPARRAAAIKPVNLLGGH